MISRFNITTAIFTTIGILSTKFPGTYYKLIREKVFKVVGVDGMEL